MKCVECDKKNESCMKNNSTIEKYFKNPAYR